tara:strand:+ start:36189 stop:38786 length:2598 start_codon:yes stop_codon:yes gene_type:complete
MAMAGKQTSVFLVSILLFSLVSHVQASDESEPVAQFGIGFDEVVIVDASDGLLEPRDLEFHPGRTNELWIANRGDDSMTIVHNTGLENQTSETREDSNSNHFLEEVSAIAFGAYHPEFDWQWGSAQETQNTYCGLGTPNQFMGPTLWPSSLDHYAVENQNNGNGLLGSHIDMNHESPDGMGIAHDNGNAYWYFDGYYGELVYYDFQIDHDTGQDDHSDGIVHRYSDVQLTRDAGIPGHMILDKESGILYIADTGASRILWVNTDDTTIDTVDIMNDPSRLEPLAEYKRKTGIEWGILDTGLNRPSGIALDGDTLFISENGNGKITAYDLSEDGKSASERATVQTSAVFIMGLEIGPDGHLYYVDNGQDQVVRIDPHFDTDADGIYDADDNCILIPNSDQANLDGDNLGDVCDEDDDNDSILDAEDSCPMGETGWSSRSFTDLDGDGCRDDGEDLDDDDDGVCDGLSADANCVVSTVEYDLCSASSLSFESNLQTDNDGDGCEDASEDNDDDNDGFFDVVDDCSLTSGTSTEQLIGCVDSDGDGFADTIDTFPIDGSQWFDTDGDGFGDEVMGTDGDYCPDTPGTSTIDRIGCVDSDGDGYSDPDNSWTAGLGGDAFPNDETQHFDGDGDGYGDNQNGNQPDFCPGVFGTSNKDLFGCRDSDGDGWSDVADQFNNDNTQWFDQDGDGYGDEINGNLPDSCPDVFGNSTIQRYGCLDSDGDGLDDELDAFPNDSTETVDSDGDGVGDNSDVYPQDASKTKLEIESEESSSMVDMAIIVGIIFTIIVVLALFVTRRKSSRNSAIPAIDMSLETIFAIQDNVTPNPIDIQPLEMPDTAPTGPPLPDEGLPPGWTMEQWAWYGEDYLRNQ